MRANAKTDLKIRAENRVLRGSCYLLMAGAIEDSETGRLGVGGSNPLAPTNKPLINKAFFTEGQQSLKREIGTERRQIESFGSKSPEIVPNSVLHPFPLVIQRDDGLFALGWHEGAASPLESRSFAEAVAARRAA
ncbi:hypothetical protein GGQ85_001681 [Nitrobacter vulgaris]|uniref:hypothetical protein n=1 Tax=Nitrobacter vulgaris TaxID=29421 RepID=UPI00285D3282|nr:hypothetical protein [Nitrobacter vulgaris]MDR6303982.1 hypothetical protein [Nitrobacter vulgaris]